MTREEAVETLEGILKWYHGISKELVIGEKPIEAFEMAVNALQEKQAKDYIEQGRNEAWGALRTVIGLGEPLEICGVEGFRSFVCGVSASKAISIIKAYKEKKKQENSEIHVGDEVVLSDGTKLIVLSLSKDRETFDGIYVDGSGADILLDKSRVNKTGRHCPEIEEALKKMQEGE